ncbi:unnamed protein product, partial [Symbiodinium sp. CCMP2456]
HKGKNKEGNAFPAYDAMPITPAVTAATAATSTQSAPPEDFEVPTVQKALNQARKTELRLQKLVTERHRSTMQWDQYVRNQKKAYLEQKQRHLQALEAYDHEIQAAKEAQNVARLQLRQTVLNEQQTGAMEGVVSVEDAEWDTMLASWDQERTETADGVLRRALLEATATRTPLRSTTAAPRTPPAALTVRTDAVLPTPTLPAAAYTSRPESSTRDPYQVASPVVATPHGAPHTSHTGGYGVMVEPTERPSPYSGVYATKEEAAAVGVIPHPSLAERVQAKKAALGAALTPFGSGKTVTPPGLGGEAAPSTTTPSGMVPTVLEDDDDEDLQEPGQDSSYMPALGGLE